MMDDETAYDPTEEFDQPLDPLMPPSSLRHLRPDNSLLRSELSDFTLYRNQREERRLQSAYRNLDLASRVASSDIDQQRRVLVESLRRTKRITSCPTVNVRLRQRQLHRKHNDTTTASGSPTTTNPGVENFDGKCTATTVAASELPGTFQRSTSFHVPASWLEDSDTDESDDDGGRKVRRRQTKKAKQTSRRQAAGAANRNKTRGGDNTNAAVDEVVGNRRLGFRTKSLCDCRDGSVDRADASGNTGHSDNDTKISQRKNPNAKTLACRAYSIDVNDMTPLNVWNDEHEERGQNSSRSSDMPMTTRRVSKWRRCPFAEMRSLSLSLPDCNEHSGTESPTSSPSSLNKSLVTRESSLSNAGDPDVADRVKHHQREPPLSDRQPSTDAHCANPTAFNNLPVSKASTKVNKSNALVSGSTLTRTDRRINGSNIANRKTVGSSVVTRHTTEVAEGGPKTTEVLLVSNKASDSRPLTKFASMIKNVCQNRVTATTSPRNSRSFVQTRPRQRGINRTVWNAEHRQVAAAMQLTEVQQSDIDNSSCGPVTDSTNDVAGYKLCNDVGNNKSNNSRLQKGAISCIPAPIRCEASKTTAQHCSTSSVSSRFSRGRRSPSVSRLSQTVTPFSSTSCTSSTTSDINQQQRLGAATLIVIGSRRRSTMFQLYRGSRRGRQGRPLPMTTVLDVGKTVKPSNDVGILTGPSNVREYTACTAVIDN